MPEVHKINRAIGTTLKIVIFIVFVIILGISAYISPYVAIAVGIVIGFLVRALFDRELDVLANSLRGLDEREYVPKTITRERTINFDDFRAHVDDAYDYSRPILTDRQRKGKRREIF